jgi:hypothetical protein
MTGYPVIQERVLADAAVWAGAVGTWVVGIAAAIIAGFQLYRAGFRPKLSVYQDAENRIMLQLINRGQGLGTIIDIDLINRHDPDAQAIPYYWEVANEQVTLRPLPFRLDGQATVRIVLRPVRPTDITEATRVRINYGNARLMRCVPIVHVKDRIYGTTTLE